MNSTYNMHREMAQKITEEARDSQSRYHHKVIGLANGKVVAVGDDLDSVVSEVERIEPNNLNTFVWHVDWDENEIVEIWNI